MSDALVGTQATHVLRIRHADGREEVLPLREENVTIGRAGINGIVLRDALASRFHARIQWERGRYLLTDRGSRNGVLVGGRPVQSHLLSPDDEIVLGDTTLVFEAAPGPDEGTATADTASFTRTDALPEELDPMARELAAADELDALEGMAVHLRAVVACDRCAIVLFDALGRVLRRYTRSAVPGGAAEGPDESVLEAGRNAPRPVAMSLARDAAEIEATLDVSRHVLLVPIHIEDTQVGLISMEREPWRPPFAPGELRLVAAAGAQARTFLRRFA